MNKKIISILAGFILFPGIINNTLFSELIFPFKSNPPQETSVVEEWENKGTNQYKLNHQQELWIGNLEWCESRGKQTALNACDLDGTPSYSWFQFKPGTVKHYAVKYELIDAKTAETYTNEDWINWAHDYDFIKEIVTRMIGDLDVIWRKEIKQPDGSIRVVGEFPGCVKLYGYPPK